MILRSLLAAAALLATQSDATGTPESAISIMTGSPEQRVRVRVDPGGVMRIEQVGEAVPAMIDTGFTGYRRMAALLGPVRRWAGQTLPCDDKPLSLPTDPAAPPLAGWPEALVTVRWESDGAEVKVPVTCMRSPAAGEIELVRAALDEVKRWSGEAQTDASADPAANAASVDIGNMTDD